MPALLTFDIGSDVALLRFERHSHHTPSPHGPDASAFPGDPVVVIGDPLGLTGSVSTGILAAMRSADSVPEVQFTAPISPGSSRGPLVDARGRAIGIVKATLSDGQNLNLAVSTSVAKAIRDQFAHEGFDRKYIVVPKYAFIRLHHPSWSPTTDPVVRQRKPVAKIKYADPSTFFDDPIERPKAPKKIRVRPMKTRRPRRAVKRRT